MIVEPLVTIPEHIARETLCLDKVTPWHQLSNLELDAMLGILVLVEADIEEMVRQDVNLWFEEAFAPTSPSTFNEDMIVLTKGNPVFEIIAGTNLHQWGVGT